MVVSKSGIYTSPEDYLKSEEQSPIKHEYIRGEIYGMAGGSDAHDAISLNLLTLLKNHLRGSGCRAYTGNMKVYIELANVYYYPKAMVTCDERDRKLQYFKQYPCLIIEVLSPSTEAFDRGGKFADYRLLESLQEYVLVSQERMSVECFRRNPEGQWVLHPFGMADTVEFASIGFRCEMAALYEDVPDLMPSKQ
ncbi:Uma2 family endonuclease [Leptothermofonsia sp. ETS-13]|uniref:Uma2 family endonuclease n=1 Tax=Leptothermofonsia sp. ETS-13 TaxID=3035696 RepID=UPI003BA18C18